MVLLYIIIFLTEKQFIHREHGLIISNNSEHIIEFENFACALKYDKDKIVRMVFEGEP